MTMARGSFRVVARIATLVVAYTPVVLASAISAGTNLTVAPCHPNPSQQLYVNATDNTVRSSDGSLCVTWIGDSPAPLQMEPCLGSAALTQVRIKLHLRLSA